MVNKHVAGCRSYYHGETTVPAFSFPIKHDDPKNQRIRFVKDRQPNLALFVIYISHIAEKFFKKLLKSKEESTDSLKPVLSIYPNIIQSSAIP